MNIKIAIVTVASIASLSSCYSPKPVLRFKPEETKTTWDKGKEFVCYKNGEYEVYSSYYGSDDKYIIFDIEIVNNKGEEFLIAPENILLYPGIWDSQKQCTIYDTIHIQAVDPEAEILKIDLENSKAEASSKNAQVAAIAIFSAAIPLTIVASANDYKHPRNYNSSVSNSEIVEAGTELALGTTIINHDNQENQIVSLNDTKNTWEASSLRKTTLSPGYSIRGLVFFSIPDIKYQKIKYNVPIPGGVITFKYDFLKFYPTNN